MIVVVFRRSSLTSIGLVSYVILGIIIALVLEFTAIMVVFAIILITIGFMIILVVVAIILILFASIWWLLMLEPPRMLNFLFTIF